MVSIGSVWKEISVSKITASGVEIIEGGFITVAKNRVNFIGLKYIDKIIVTVILRIRLMDGRHACNSLHGYLLIIDRIDTKMIG